MVSITIWHTSSFLSIMLCLPFLYIFRRGWTFIINKGGDETIKQKNFGAEICGVSMKEWTLGLSKSPWEHIMFFFKSCNGENLWGALFGRSNTNMKTLTCENG